MIGAGSDKNATKFYFVWELNDALGFIQSLIWSVELVFTCRWARGPTMWIRTYFQSCFLSEKANILACNRVQQPFLFCARVEQKLYFVQDLDQPKNSILHIRWTNLKVLFCVRVEQNKRIFCAMVEQSQKIFCAKDGHSKIFFCDGRRNSLWKTTRLAAEFYRTSFRHRLWLSLWRVEYHFGKLGSSS